MLKPKTIPMSWVVKRPKSRPMAGRHSNAFYHTARWTRESRAFRQEQPFCAECARHDHVEASEVVDHIIPLDLCEDPWDKSNWEALCRRHNNIKAARDKKQIKKSTK